MNDCLLCGAHGPQVRMRMVEWLEPATKRWDLIPTCIDRAECRARVELHEKWPLTDEFWYPRQGCRRCRACINETQTKGARRSRAEVTAVRRSCELRRKRDWARAKRARLRQAA